MQLINEQQDISRRYNELKNQPTLSSIDHEQLQRLATQELDLIKELADITEQLRQLATDPDNIRKLPNTTSSALKMCDKIDQLQIADDLQNAAQHSQNKQASSAYEAAQTAADKLDSLLSDCDTMQGSPCLDCFILPKQNMKNALKQLRQARGMPGSGSGGRDGYGMYGSQARMSLRGPAKRSSGGGDGNRGVPSPGKGKNTKINPNDIESLTPSEALSANDLNDRTSNATQLRGTPLPYREEASAYFQRLAEDQAAIEQPETNQGNQQ